MGEEIKIKGRIILRGGVSGKGASVAKSRLAGKVERGSEVN